MGDLYVNNNRIDDKLYCKLCFEAEMTKEHGMLSKVYSLGEKTSSGNFLAHAKAAHKESTIFLKEQSSKLTNWIQTVPKGSPATSQFDVNRDIVLWLCQDLLPFELIEKGRFSSIQQEKYSSQFANQQSPCNNSPGRCLHGFEVQSQRTTGRHCQWYYNVRWLD